MRPLLIVCALVFLSAAHAGELYRYIDSSGHVQYSDKPTPDAERLKLGSEPAPDDSLPYETQQAKRFFPVTLYTFEECTTPCKEARQFLKARGIPYTEKSLTTKEEMDAFLRASGSNQAPAMTVGKTWVNGFLSEQWDKELNFAGYPKTAPYRAKSAAPQ